MPMPHASHYFIGDSENYHPHLAGDFTDGEVAV